MLCCFGSKLSLPERVTHRKDEDEKTNGRTNSKFDWFSRLPTSIYSSTDSKRPQGKISGERPHAKEAAVKDKAIITDKPDSISATENTPGEPNSQTKERLDPENKVNENLKKLINFAYKPLKPTLWQRLHNFFRWLFCQPLISLGEARVELTQLENKIIDEVIEIKDNKKYIRLDTFNGEIDKDSLDPSLENIPHNDIASIITIISENQQFNQLCSGVVTSVLSDEPYNAIKPRGDDTGSCSIRLINIDAVTKAKYIVSVKSLDTNLDIGSVLAVHSQLEVDREELGIKQQINSNRLFVASKVNIREIVIRNLIDAKNNEELHENFKYMRITENMDGLDPNNQSEKEILIRISKLAKKTLEKSRRDNESIKEKYYESKNKENNENIQNGSLQLKVDNNEQAKSNTQKGYFDRLRSFKIYFNLGAPATINLN